MYVDDTWVKVRTREVEDFTEHINAVNSNIMFTREDVRGDCLPLLDSTVHIRDDRSLNIEVFTENLHTDQYLLFDSHHPLGNKLGVIRKLNHWAESVPTKTEGKETEQKHIRGALKTCGYQNWTFVKTTKRSQADRKEKPEKKNVTIVPLTMCGNIWETQKDLQ